jgi:hypothetical protein
MLLPLSPISHKIKAESITFGLIFFMEKKYLLYPRTNYSIPRFFITFR